MKKTRNYFWPLKPIVTILLFCGLAFPAISLSAERAYGDDLLGSVANQQQFKVTGTVTDNNNGQAMPGVNIQVKGTNIGAISDENGKYTISGTDQNPTLVFSFIGYVTTEVIVGGRSVIDLAMKGELTDLEEVVVVGYTTQKRANVVGSVTSISGDVLQGIPAT